MKVLKLKLFQESACYKKPFAYKVTETYPLPPYSTVSGMMHSLLGADSYVPMEISIQGDYESIFNSYNTMYFYKSNSVTSMPLNTHMLFGINLIIHIKAEENVLMDIIERFKNSEEHLSLGRREDMVRVDDIGFVDVEEIDAADEDEYIIIKRPIYIPKEKIQFRCSGIGYRLNYKYDVQNNLRLWKRVDVIYAEKGQQIDEGNILMDSQGDIVFFAYAGE